MSGSIPSAKYTVASRSAGCTGFSLGEDAVASDSPYCDPRAMPAPATTAL